MRINTYLKEIKYRTIIVILSILINMLIILTYKEQITYLIGQHQNTILPYFVTTKLTEIFLSVTKFSLFLSIYFTYPTLLLQVYFFLTPGLYKFEHKLIKTLFALSLIMFYTCTIITYKIFIPYCWDFFSNFELKTEETIVGVHLETSLNEYLDFFQKVFLSLNLLFHSLLIITIFIKNMKTNQLIKKRKIIYLLGLILGTMFSPPDIFSQIVIGSCCTLFFEFFLLFNFINEEYKRANNGSRTRNFQSHNLTL